MNAQRHLTNEERAAWWQGALAPDLLLEVSDHLQSCESCRVALRNTTKPAGLSGSAAQPGMSSPSYEELVAWMEGELDPLARRELRQRLAASTAASAELEDLHRFREEMRRLPPREYSPAYAGMPRASWILPIAAGLALGLAFIWWNSLSQNGAGIALRDAGKSLVVRQDGTVRGLGPLPAAFERTIANAFAGKVAPPEEVEKLRGTRGALAGAPATGGEFAVIAPLATLVETPRPTFRWRKKEHATGYRVNLIGQGSENVVSSPVVSAMEWKPQQPLAPGATYEWEVEALRDGELIAKAPAPPEPEARFAILPNDKREELERLRATFGRSHLVMGLGYEKAGLIPQARQEFEALARENPKSDLPRKLIAGLTGQRPTRTNGAQ